VSQAKNTFFLFYNLKKDNNKKLKMECDFCKKNLSSLSALKYHQKTAKYCLTMQGRTSGGNFDCNYCDRKFNTKQHLTTHYISCKEKNQKIK
jgi:hypothetical protein